MQGHTRSLTVCCAALALLLGGLTWFAPGAISERVETRDVFAAVAESSRKAAVTTLAELEAEPEIPRSPAGSLENARVSAEPPQDEVVAQREELRRELADVTARVERLSASIAERDEASERSPAPVDSTRLGFLLPAPRDGENLVLGEVRFDPIVERNLDQVRMDLERYVMDLETRLEPPSEDSETSMRGFGCGFCAF